MLSLPAPPASNTLTLEKIRLLESPRCVPSCNINPILSHGSVMRTGQASAFGFPDPLIGVAAFAVVVTVGVVLLTGARLPRPGAGLSPPCRRPVPFRNSSLLVKLRICTP